MRSQSLILAAEAAARSSGLSVAEVCRRAGINRGTWTRWKSGTSAPNLGKWFAVEAVLGPIRDTMDEVKSSEAA